MSIQPDDARVDDDQEGELARLRQENTRLLDDLEYIYQQFLLVKGESDVSYAQLRERNQALETRVVELKRAYAELEEAEKQLIHSERLAAMGQLAASIVHELNRPLAAISGYVELLLLRSPLNDNDRRMLTVVQQQSESMTNLVRDILSFSRKQEMPFDTVDVNLLLDSVITFLERIQKNRAIVISKHLDQTLSPIRASAQQLQQVFINLITNAFDALANGGVLSIETTIVDSTALVSLAEVEGNLSARPVTDVQALVEKYPRFISIRFQDTGSGIPPDILGSIFQPFFTTKEAGKGTGLGLSICRTIIERHEGTIVVTSTPGLGTAFTVLLPVASAAGGGRMTRSSTQ